MSTPSEFRSLPPRPDVEQLRRQAKELLAAARRGDESAVARLGSQRARLADAQFVLARE